MCSGLHMPTETHVRGQSPESEISGSETPGKEKFWLEREWLKVTPVDVTEQSILTEGRTESRTECRDHREREDCS